METVELTILMPCLNEAETLACCIEKAKTFLATHGVQGEILVADNGSHDGSQAIATTHGARLLTVATKGYGAALKDGIRAAKGRYIIMGDADDSYDFLHLGPFLTKLREGFDLVMGNRFKGGIIEGAMPLLNRYLGNPVLSFLGRQFFKSTIGDFHCGLRGFNRAAFAKLALKGDGMEFASEMVVKATLQKLKIAEVPIYLYPDGRSRAPHLRPWRDGWRHLRLLLLFSPRWLFLYPGFFLIIIGSLLLMLIMFGGLVIGDLNLGIHTMLFASSFVVLGLQAVFFAIFANYIAYYSLNISAKPLISRFYQFFSLERGLIIGLILFLIGLTLSGYGFWFWSHHAFGPLDPTYMMRLLIPAMTCLITGGQIIFGSFFLGLLKMHVEAK